MKKIFSLLILVCLLTTLCSCTNKETDTDENTSSLAPVSSADPKEAAAKTVPWPQTQALESLPKIAESVDFYLDESNGGAEGSYNIKIKNLSYEDYVKYTTSLFDEHGYTVWNTLGEVYVPEKLEDNERALCPVTNGSLWGIIEYTSQGNADGYNVDMLFYNYNPYSGY